MQQTRFDAMLIHIKTNSDDSVSPALVVLPSAMIYEVLEVVGQVWSVHPSERSLSYWGGKLSSRDTLDRLGIGGGSALFLNHVGDDSFS
ncbi:hypothetical protein BGZ58_001222, partial [Dissophora ornata]